MTKKIFRIYYINNLSLFLSINLKKKASMQKRKRIYSKEQFSGKPIKVLNFFLNHKNFKRNQKLKKKITNMHIFNLITI